MKSILLVISSLLIATCAATLDPVDSSSSTVNVKQNGNEYSYTIHQSRGVAVDHPLPILKADIPQHIFLNPLQPKIVEELRQEKIEDHMGAEGQIKESKEAMEKQPVEQLKAIAPDYRLISTTAGVQYVDSPYYLPYYYRHANLYPYNFVRYF